MCVGGYGKKKEKDSKKKKRAVLSVLAEWRLKLGFSNESFTLVLNIINLGQR